MTIKKIIIYISLFICCNYVRSQEVNFQEQESSIISLAKTILAGETDSLRDSANNQLKKLLIDMINTKKSYQYEFKKTEHISILQPQDKKFKIITWFVPYINGDFKYFGVIQKCNKRGTKCHTYILEDNIELMQNNTNTNITFNKWYGCLYYNIIPIKIGKKTYYTLLGWDGSSPDTNKKIIDVLTINKKEDPVFGADIFNNKKTRIIIEYSSQYPISLQYDSNLEYIVFDHLEQIDEISINNFSIYATNLSYDVFKKTKLGWELEQKIYLNNRK